MQFVLNSQQMYEQNINYEHSTTKARQVCGTPERILDAPDLLDDYYLNLLDWGKNGCLAVGLGTCLYLWNATTGEIDLLVENENENCITSVRYLKKLWPVLYVL